MDRADACEMAAKEAKIRSLKAEEDVAELVKKSQQLEQELDKTKEELMTIADKGIFKFQQFNSLFKTMQFYPHPKAALLSHES